MDDVLDNPMGGSIDAPARPTGIKYGLILGVISIVLGLVYYLLGWMDPQSMGSKFTSIFSFAITIAVLVMAIRHHRDSLQGGYIAFGKCVGIGLWVGLIAGIIGLVWSLVFFNFIVPDYFVSMKDMLVDTYEAQGLSDEQIEMAMKYVGWMMSPTSMAIMALIGSIFTALIFSLIVGAFMKKDPPTYG
jgi:hypothetical protein